MSLPISTLRILLSKGVDADTILEVAEAAEAERAAADEARRESAGRAIVGGRRHGMTDTSAITAITTLVHAITKLTLLCMVRTDRPTTAKRS